MGSEMCIRDSLRTAISARAVRSQTVTVTFGVSEVRDGETAEQAISRADNALYQGKRSGRNRVQRATVAA